MLTGRRLSTFIMVFFNTDPDIWHKRSIKDPINSNPLIISFDLAWKSAVTEFVKSKAYLVMTRETMELKFWDMRQQSLGLNTSISVNCEFWIHTNIFQCFYNIDKKFFKHINTINSANSLSTVHINELTIYLLFSVKCSARIEARLKK